MGFQLPPGFRFHPTDEELVKYYLTRKVCSKKIGFDAIGVIDLYKYEPWELPEKSFLQTKDLEWYFFNPRDRKYVNSSRTNRATEKGYWKATGKDRSIMSGSRHVGMKKTLVYYNGRAPKAERTNWVMHEYRLNDDECERLHASQNDFVLCRIHQKSGPGPKNGEQYGAPVEDDDLDEFKEEDLKDPLHYDDANDPIGNDTIFRRDDIMASLTVDNPIVKHEEFSAAISLGDVRHVDSCVTGTVNTIQMDFCVNRTRDLMFPNTLDSENCILQELYEVVTSSSSKETDISLNDNSQPPTDGDFLELNDLFLTYKTDDGSKKCEDCSGLISCNLLEQHEPNEYHMIQQVEIKQNVQKMGPLDVIDQNLHPMSNCSSPLESSLFSAENGMAIKASAAGELEYSNILELFEPVNALFHEENESLGVGFTESTQRSLVDVQYFDALQFFEDVNDIIGNSEMNNMAYQDQNWTLNDQNAVEESQYKGSILAGISEHYQDQNTSDENDSQESHQKGSVLAGASHHHQKGIGIVLKYLESLPAFPASAADLSPKDTASDVPLRCSCMEKTIGSVCAKCSYKKGKFIRSLSMNAAQRNVDNASRIGFFIVVFLVVIWIMFWVLIAGGIWKLVEVLGTVVSSFKQLI